MMRRLFCLIGLMFLEACGGSDSSKSPVTIPSLPSLSVTLTPSVTRQAATEADTTSNFTVQASYSGTTTDPIFPKFDYDSALLSMDGAIAQSGTSYTAKFKTPADLSAISHKIKVTSTLCRNSGGASVHPGSTQSIDYNLDVKIGDWITAQRNAAHNGYVHAKFDATKFTKAWDFVTNPGAKLGTVSAREGSVFISMTDENLMGFIISFDGKTGVERWKYQAGQTSEMSGPALSSEALVTSWTPNPTGTPALITLNPSTGQFITNFQFSSKLPFFLYQPTPFDDFFYQASGQGFSDVAVYAYDLKNLAKIWQRGCTACRVEYGQGVAADASHIYFYNGNLDVIDRKTGNLVKSIVDPLTPVNGTSYWGSPMIGSSNNIIAFSGSGLSPQPSNSQTPALFNSLFLVNFDINSGNYRWKTSVRYTATPAVSKGVIYALTTPTSELHAIDEATGNIVWTWKAPANEFFQGNVVVTDNLVFLSTDKAIYAVDMSGDHQTKWTVPTPGSLSITPDKKLISASIWVNVTPAVSQRITAYSLE